MIQGLYRKAANTAISLSGKYVGILASELKIIKDSLNELTPPQNMSVVDYVKEMVYSGYKVKSVGDALYIETYSLQDNHLNGSIYIEGTLTSPTVTFSKRKQVGNTLIITKTLELVDKNGGLLPTPLEMEGLYDLRYAAGKVYIEQKITSTPPPSLDEDIITERVESTNESTLQTTNNQNGIYLSIIKPAVKTTKIVKFEIMANDNISNGVLVMDIDSTGGIKVYLNSTLYIRDAITIKKSDLVNGTSIVVSLLTNTNNIKHFSITKLIGGDITLITNANGVNLNNVDIIRKSDEYTFATTEDGKSLLRDYNELKYNEDNKRINISNDYYLEMYSQDGKMILDMNGISGSFLNKHSNALKDGENISTVDTKINSVGTSVISSTNEEDELRKQNSVESISVKDFDLTQEEIDSGLHDKLVVNSNYLKIKGRLKTVDVTYPPIKPSTDGIDFLSETKYGFSPTIETTDLLTHTTGGLYTLAPNIKASPIPFSSFILENGNIPDNMLLGNSKFYIDSYGDKNKYMLAIPEDGNGEPIRIFQHSNRRFEGTALSSYFSLATSSLAQPILGTIVNDFSTREYKGDGSRRDTVYLVMHDDTTSKNILLPKRVSKLPVNAIHSYKSLLQVQDVIVSAEGNNEHVIAHNDFYCVSRPVWVGKPSTTVAMAKMYSSDKNFYVLSPNTEYGDCANDFTLAGYDLSANLYNVRTSPPSDIRVRGAYTTYLYRYGYYNDFYIQRYDKPMNNNDASAIVVRYKTVSDYVKDNINVTCQSFTHHPLTATNMNSGTHPIIDALLDPSCIYLGTDTKNCYDDTLERRDFLKLFTDHLGVTITDRGQTTTLYGDNDYVSILDNHMFLTDAMEKTIEGFITIKFNNDGYGYVNKTESFVYKLDLTKDNFLETNGTYIYKIDTNYKLNEFNNTIAYEKLRDNKIVSCDSVGVLYDRNNKMPLTYLGKSLLSDGNPLPDYTNENNVIDHSRRDSFFSDLGLIVIDVWINQKSILVITSRGDVFIKKLWANGTNVTPTDVPAIADYFETKMGWNKLPGISNAISFVKDQFNKNIPTPIVNTFDGTQYSVYGHIQSKDVGDTNFENYTTIKGTTKFKEAGALQPLNLKNSNTNNYTFASVIDSIVL